MEALWWAEAGRNQVLPLFEFPDSMAHMHPGEFPPPTGATYRPGGGPVQDSQLPDRDGRLRADRAGRGARRAAPTASSPRSATGTAAGRSTCSTAGRWRPFALLDGPVRVAGGAAVPSGEHVLELRYEPGRAARVVLARRRRATSARRRCPG